MEAKAIAKNIRISADKARLVADLIRGKKVDEAMSILKNMNKKAARVIEKVLTSAVANATNNHNLNKDKLRWGATADGSRGLLVPLKDVKGLYSIINLDIKFDI